MAATSKPMATQFQKGRWWWTWSGEARAGHICVSPSMYCSIVHHQ